LNIQIAIRISTQIPVGARLTGNGILVDCDDHDGDGLGVLAGPHPGMDSLPLPSLYCFGESGDFNRLFRISSSSVHATRVRISMKQTAEGPIVFATNLVMLEKSFLHLETNAGERLQRSLARGPFCCARRTNQPNEDNKNQQIRVHAN
jgi:hypothetical protein